MNREEIINRFGYHKPADEESAQKHEVVRTEFIDFTSAIANILPEGRAKSLALTKLQEASMWAHFALAEQNPIVWPVESRSEIMDDAYEQADQQ